MGSTWYKGDKHLTVKPVLNGLESNLKLQSGISSYGRMYVGIGNNKSAITSDAYFSVLGKYAHAILDVSIVPSVGPGTISFSPAGSWRVKESSTTQLSYILTY